jgi:signal transduction histidine kinase
LDTQDRFDPRFLFRLVHGRIVKAQVKEERPSLQRNGQNNKGKTENTNDSHLSRLAAIGEISAGIAHEVRNPLTAVKGFLQLLQEKYDDKYIDIAHAELDNAITVLQDLLQISRPDIDEPIQEVSLSVLLESLLNLFQDQIYRVEVKRGFTNTDKKIYGRRNQLKKAFFNILKNAFESIQDKGTITVKHFFEDNQVHVQICDTGSGIPEDRLRSLGTPFFSTKENGTGMGVAQVFNTIYGHNGTIEVQSAVGIGTEFLITLPVESKTVLGVVELDLQYMTGQSMREFYLANHQQFNEILLFGRRGF